MVKAWVKWALALAVLAVGLLGIHRLSLKPNLPFQFYFVDHHLLAREDYQDQIRSGDEVLAFEGRGVATEHELEFLFEGKAIGDTVALAIRSDGLSKEVSVPLSPAYPDSFYYLTSLVIGLALWVTALFIMLKRPEEKAASVVFWSLMLFALAIMTSSGNYSARPRFIVYVIYGVYNVSYALGVSTFLHFVMVFPRQKWRQPIIFLAILYFFGALIGGALAATHTLAIAKNSLKLISLHEDLYKVLRTFLVTGIVGGLGILLHSYLRSQTEGEKRKIEWILWGGLVGVSPFLFLHTIPNLLFSQSLLREELALAFLIVIPISFAIAIVKHHIFDIQVIIRRSIVYALLTGTVVGFYFLIVVAAGLVLRRIVGESQYFFSFLAAVGVALLFNPARNRIQRFVDRTFYRVRYDFREAIQALNSEIKECVTLNQLAELVIQRVDSLIPVERIALIGLVEPGHRMRILAHRGFDVAAKHIPSLHVEQITTDLKLPVALPTKVEAGAAVETGMTHVFERWGISLAIPLSLLPRQIVGVIVFGDKRSGAKYSSSDLDLLSAISSQVALAIERLQLQEQLIVGEMEKKRLEELNQLKSEFVSSVSHELRTPLTSIQMFAETLLSRNVKSERKRTEYLKIIQGESERLTRLINNILDFAKIERGVKQYSFGPVDIRAVLEGVLKSMEYQFNKLKFQVRARIPKRAPTIEADGDAVAEAVINLLSNAMKYSGKSRKIDVSLRRYAEALAIEVKDHGIGIPESEMAHIFEKFYRVHEGAAKHAGGAGLGLALVQHIMTAHGGEVKVQSKVNKGSTFTLLFPIKRSSR